MWMCVGSISALCTRMKTKSSHPLIRFAQRSFTLNEKQSWWIPHETIYYNHTGITEKDKRYNMPPGLPSISTTMKSFVESIYGTGNLFNAPYWATARLICLFMFMSATRICYKLAPESLFSATENKKPRIIYKTIELWLPQLYRDM